jgi:hypothetical protein
MWRMRERDMAAFLDVDRMHLNGFGHQRIALAVLDALGVEHALVPDPPLTLPELSRREQLRANATWTRDFLAPWVQRRLTGRSSGDTVEPKRPTLAPVEPPTAVR